MALEDARQCFAARILCGAGYAVTSPGCRRAPLSPLGQPRGWSVARRIHSIRAWRSAGVSDETRAPRGAPSRRFQSPGPCFRARRGRCSPALIRAAFAALHPRRVQPFKAAPIVRADGHPRPPGSGVTSAARRRRIRLHHRDVSRRRPQPSRTIGKVYLVRADAPEFLAGAGIRRAIHERSPQRSCLRPGLGPRRQESP